MFTYTKLLVSISICLLFLIGCQTSPTGRKQLLLIPQGQMAQMGSTAFTQMKGQRPISKDLKQVRYVECIANAITQQLDGNQQRAWEVSVFADNSANVFPLPGGKMGVHTGLLKIATNQSQLASVMGHEVGHVLANHGNERMSIQQVTQTGTQVLQALSGKLLGLGTQFGITLPFSRKHESEADYIGLKLMAKAGFDPRESVSLWQNMAKASGGKSPAEFMSTHPSNQTRIRDLNRNMGEALNIYQQARARGINPKC